MSLGGANDEASFGKPVPRDPKSSPKLAQIRIQNRRREYLQRHPSYLQHLEHELADPILYERLVKRYQSPAEREKEGKAKGYGRTLEADLVRGETRLAEVNPERDGRGATSGEASETNNQENGSHPTFTLGSGQDDPWDQQPDSKEEGLELWRTFITERFVAGWDEEFDYMKVDGDDEYDDLERRDKEDAWFDDEEPSWHEDKAGDDNDGGGGTEMTGETGIQDF